MARHQGIIFDALFGIVATIMSFLLEMYLFHSRDAFTSDIIIKSFIAGYIASFIARKVARKLNIRITL